MILSDGTLHRMLETFIQTEANHALVNPASIDIRIGRNGMWDVGRGEWVEKSIDENGRYIESGQLVLVETYERIHIPAGYAAELKLKSTTARMGFNHSLAFWIDPGWEGILTMEITNLRRDHSLEIFLGMKFAQLIVHRLDTDVQEGYSGRYQNASSVEGVK